MTAYEQVARIADTFPRQQVTQATIDVYVAELAGIDPELLDRAVTELLRTSDWFPTVAAIRNRCAELTLRLPPETEAWAAVEAYAAEVRAMPEEATGRPPRLHPLVRRALTLNGGIRAYRASERPGVWRADFMRSYRELRAAEILTAQTADAISRPGVYPAIGEHDGD